VACKRSEDVKRGPILSECRGSFTLQIDRFTMGGVNHRGVTSSKLNHTIRNLSVHIRKNQRGLEVDNWKAVPVHNYILEIWSEKTRGRVIIYFLVGLFWKRRLVAEEGS